MRLFLIGIVWASTALIAADPPVFENITGRTKIDFHHRKSGTPNKYLIETMSGGVAMFDYDGDGRLDLYFVNGAELTEGMKAGAAPGKSGPRFWNRLYRNQGDGSFRDVTETAGVRGQGYEMGAAAGDYDNDGRVDLYVTAYGGNVLYRNRGDGSFEDVTKAARVAGGGWSTGAAWVDYDHDGRLDLIVARYLKWDFEPDTWCGARQAGYRSYCHPNQFQPATHLVYRNRGDGTFEDATVKSGWGASPGKGLGIAIADYDRDGRIDIAVANDSAPQQLFRNLGGGKFEEVGLTAGVGYDDDGQTYAGMGIDFADYDNDGWPDLFVNALSLQRYALYRNRKGTFDYASNATGVGRITRLHSGWGVRFVDFDNDGWKDVFVAQGHVMDNISLTQPSLRYVEPPLLMRNQHGKFSELLEQSGAACAARGAAFGDLDNDGWVDVAINCNDGPPVVLRNQGAKGNHWLTIDLTGSRGIGAKVRVVTPDGAERHATVTTAGSYLSSSDPRAHFGLGGNKAAKLVEVVWPDGRMQTLENVPADQAVKVTQR